MARRWGTLAGVACALAMGCDSSGGADAATPPPDAASEDGAVALDAAVPLPTTCGDPPHVTLSTTVTSYGTGLPVRGAEFTTDLCPGERVVSDRRGLATGRITRDVPVITRVTAEGYLPMLLPEARYTGDLEGVAELYPLAVTALLPHWSETSPTILVRIFADPAATAPCDDASGHTVGVVDHPEAIVTYYGGTVAAPMPDPSLTSTGPLGAAEIAGLAPTGAGALLELSVEKEGCPVSFVSYPHTGRFALEEGTLTLAVALSPPR